MYKKLIYIGQNNLRLSSRIYLLLVSVSDLRVLYHKILISNNMTYVRTNGQFVQNNKEQILSCKNIGGVDFEWFERMDFVYFGQLEWK